MPFFRNLFGSNAQTGKLENRCRLIPEYARGTANMNFVMLGKEYDVFYQLFPQEKDVERFKFLFMVACTAEGINKMTESNPGSSRSEYIDAPVTYYEHTLEGLMDYNAIFINPADRAATTESRFKQAVLTYISELSRYYESKADILASLSKDEKDRIEAYACGMWLLQKMGADHNIMDKNYELATAIGYSTIDLAKSVINGEMPVV